MHQESHTCGEREVDDLIISMVYYINLVPNVQSAETLILGSSWFCFWHLGQLLTLRVKHFKIITRWRSGKWNVEVS